MEKGTSYLLTQKTYMNANQFMFVFKCLDCPKREITCFFYRWDAWSGVPKVCSGKEGGCFIVSWFFKHSFFLNPTIPRTVSFFSFSSKPPSIVFPMNCSPILLFMEAVLSKMKTFWFHYFQIISSHFSSSYPVFWSIRYQTISQGRPSFSYHEF